MLRAILSIIVLLLAFPAGFLLARATREELVSGKKWFDLLAVVCIIAMLVLSVLSFELKMPVILTLAFITIVSLVSVYKSHDKKFVKR